MMAKIIEKHEARALRKTGMSIRDIASTLNVSKSTVSFWCRDISLTQKQLAKLTRKSLHAGQTKCIELGERKRSLRLKNRKEHELLGKKRVGKVSPRDLFFIGLGLYWGEGYKRSNDEFGFTNSDPEMITTYLAWLESIFQIDRKRDIILRVSINELHQHREKELHRYWSTLTHIPLSNFTQPSYIKTKSKKIYPDTTNHFGTLRIKVRKGSLKKFEVLGAIESVGQQFR